MKRKKQKQRLTLLLISCSILFVAAVGGLFIKKNVKRKKQQAEVVKEVSRKQEKNELINLSKKDIFHLSDGVENLTVDTNYRIVCATNGWGGTILQKEVVPVFENVEKDAPCYFLSIESDFFLIRKNELEMNVFLWMLKKTNVSDDVFINSDGHFVRFDNSYVCSKKLQESNIGICTEDSYFLE